MSRYDDVGLWWEDYPVTPSRAGRSERTARAVAVPSTGWVPPRELPNLRGVKLLGLDTETKDPRLLTHGPGGVRGDGHVVGVSVATEDRAWYFPLRHEYAGERELNMDPAAVLRWVSDTLSTVKGIVGANLAYDLEMLRAEGVTVPRAVRLHDVQVAEPLLDEEARSYSLDTLALSYTGEGKDTPLLYQWCADSFGGEPNGKQRANIWRAPPSLVGPYAESDALLPVRILRKQLGRLREQSLLDLYTLECALLPLLLDMRFRGVRVDVARAEQAAKWLREQAKLAQDAIPGVDVWSGGSIARAFDKAGVEYPRTEAGNPSFTKDFLDSCEHPMARAVFTVRMYEKAANPFVESYLLGNQLNGRVHCQFNPLRSDDYGTVTGRFSSSNPNLQNIPSRDKVLGPLLRGLFVPDEGGRWRRADYSQIEYRLLAHFAVGPRADTLRDRYRKDPKTDFHRMTAELVHDTTEVMLERTPAKNINFGLVYGMGNDKTTRSLGVSPELGARLVEAYHTAMPMVKATYKSAERLAQRRGYIRTVLGRRRRFNRTEEDKYNAGKEKRAGTHKALNAVLQGSSADIIKKAMHDCYYAGLFEPDACGVPLLTVHDELDWDDRGTPRAEEAFAEAERIMTTCVPLKVPLRLDMVTGANWGECK